MPKHDFLTPKAISNRIKAKGLQKLRWYCQMCEKQCRDENGFKCHLTSESHQRQLLLVADNPHKFTDHFSKEFLSNFISVLRRQYGTRRVLANTVYQSYISDRHHLHMNSTRWVTLGGLCQWLGRQGMCKVDETSRGWYIAYIDRDPETIARQEKLKKKERLELDDDEKAAKFIEKQVARGASSFPSTDPCFTELKREDEDELIQIRLEAKTTSLPSATSLTSNPLLALTEEKESVKLKRHSKSDVSGAKKGRQSALEEIINMEERRRERENRTDHWIRTEIVVKVQASKLGEKYLGKKGVVVGIEDKFVALVKMIDSGDVLRMDQLYLETVIPNIGREVLVVNGAYKGSKGRVVRVHSDSFSVDIEVLDGVRAGTEVKGVEYEDVCKLHKSK